MAVVRPAPTTDERMLLRLGRKARASLSSPEEDNADDEADDTKDLLPCCFVTPSTLLRGLLRHPLLPSGASASAPLRSSLSCRPSGSSVTPPAPSSCCLGADVGHPERSYRVWLYPAGVNRAMQVFAWVTAEDGLELSEAAEMFAVGKLSRVSLGSAMFNITELEITRRRMKPPLSTLCLSGSGRNFSRASRGL